MVESATLAEFEIFAAPLVSLQSLGFSKEGRYLVATALLNAKIRLRIWDLQGGPYLVYDRPIGSWWSEYTVEGNLVEVVDR